MFGLFGDKCRLVFVEDRGGGIDIDEEYFLIGIAGGYHKTIFGIGYDFLICCGIGLSVICCSRFANVAYTFVARIWGRYYAFYIIIFIGAFAVFVQCVIAQNESGNVTNCLQLFFIIAIIVCDGRIFLQEYDFF